MKHAEENGFPGRAQVVFRNDHAQDRRRRRAVESRRRSRSARGLQSHQERPCTEKAGSEAFPGRDGSEDDQAGEGYEIILGSSIDPQFGPVLLFGTGGQLVEVFKDKRAGPAAAEHHAGPPDDGADEDLSGAQRRARPQVRGPRGAGEIAGRLQPTRGRAAVDQGNRHQPAVGLRGAIWWRWMPASFCTTPRTPEDDLPRLAIRPYPTPIRHALEDEERNARSRSGRFSPRTSR